MNKKVLLVCVVSLILAVSLATSAGAKPVKANQYGGSFVSLNGSGVSGTVDMTLVHGVLSVDISIDGSVPLKSHKLAITGLRRTTAATVPPPAADVNHDGWITAKEAEKYAGTILLTFRRVPNSGRDGSICYTTSLCGYDLEPLRLDVIPLSSRVVMVYGASRPQSYGLPIYDATLPAGAADLACL